MTKMDYNRGYTSLTRPSDLPKATPVSRAQRAAYWAAKSQRKQQHKQVNQDPEILHAEHKSTVRSGNGKHYVWCDQCGCSVVELTAEEYAVWRELNPPKILRKKP